MATLKVSIPAEVLRKLKPQLARHGYTIEQYLQSSLASLADAGRPISGALEEKLIESLNSPLLRADHINWDAKIRRIRAMRRKGAV